MKKKVTIVPSDSLIIVNGEGLHFSFSAPANVHAVQWHTNSGHIEYTDGRPNQSLVTNDYAAEVAPYVEMWAAEKARLEAEAHKPPTMFEEVQAVQQQYQGALTTLATAFTTATMLGDTEDAVAIQAEYSEMLDEMEAEIAAITG